ncbi:hypothetical protein BC937DRAFT_88255 [Endogone sp. FLAS-F59071]|nr:hypothetical protein BC937DRAFT_88255 [Endogone sp. FLAS-F59071]|eukprot:RUS18860.1 hypothetical protein BC937DRAFT_88255 [Endogone sp. FLAS-F59071]
MKSFAAFVVALAALAGSNAQTPPCSLTQPLTGTTYQAGKPAIIAWIQPTVTNFSQIVLAQGNPNALTTLAIIATNIPAANGTFTWDIPSNTPAGANYALEIGTQPNVEYSGLFTILASDGSSPTPSSAAPTTEVVVTPGTTIQLSTVVAASTTPAAGTPAGTSAGSSTSTAPSAAATTIKNAAPAAAVEFKAVFGALAAVAIALAML